MGSAFLPGWGIRAGRGRPKAAEAVDAEEWFDMIAELPAEYSGLIPERSA
jgi:hypothetical protein